MSTRHALLSASLALFVTLYSGAASAQKLGLAPQIAGDVSVHGVLQAGATPDLKRLATVEIQGHDLLVWEVEEGKSPREIRRIREVWPARWGLSGRQNGPALRRDGRQVAYGGMDGFARVWDVQTGRLLRELPHSTGRGIVPAGRDPSDSPYGVSSVQGVSFNPTGRLLATTGDRRVTVWDLSTGRRRWTSPHHQFDDPEFYGVAFSPSGDVLATVADSGGVQFWSVGTGARLGALPIEKRLRPATVTFSADGSTLMVGGTFGQGPETRGFLQTWSLRTGQRVSEVSWPGLLNGASISADGRTLLGGGEHFVVWDAVTGAELAVQPVPSGPRAMRIRSEVARLAPDGNSFLTVDALGATTLWRIRR